MSNMNELQFPFNSPSLPSSPDPTDISSPVNSPEIPQSPNPATLPIKNNLFTNIVANNWSPGEKHTSQTASIPQTASPTTFNQFLQGTIPDDNLTFPTPPPRSHTREETYSPEPFTHSNGLHNPFSDDYDYESDSDELAPPPKPWMHSRHDRPGRSLGSVGSVRPVRSSSLTSSINSSGTFYTATPAAPAHYSTPQLPHRGSVSTQGRPSLTSTRRRNAKDSARFSLDREVRLREAVKSADHKLRLERARDEVRRLDPSASKSSLRLPSVKSFNARSKDYKDPVPSLLRNAIFWCALLLAQTGLVSTGAAFAILIRDRNLEDGKIPAGVVFWVVCSVAVLLIGVVWTGVMQRLSWYSDKLGFNEIRDLSGDGDLEAGRGGGLLYLDVGERDESSTLGGGNRNSVRFVRGAGGRVGEWVVGHGDRRGSMDSTLKDPIWKDLYLTPSSTRVDVGGSLGSPVLRARSKLREGGEAEDPDLGVQVLRPTPPLIRISDDRGSSTVAGGVEARFGMSGRERDAGTDYQSIPSSTKSSMVSGTSTLDDWADNVGKEIHTWSPLDRLGRVLNGGVATVGATLKEQNKFNDEEGIELADMSVPYDKIKSAKTDSKADSKNRKGKGIKWVGEQVAEFHGMWSPEIIQQRMKKRLEEKEKERLKQLKEDKGKVEGINVRERAKQFESPSPEAGGSQYKRAQDDAFVVGEDSEG